MLYSAASLAVVDEITHRLARLMKARALDLAKSQGRELITSDDVLEIFDQIGLPKELIDHRERVAAEFGE